MPQEGDIVAKRVVRLKKNPYTSKKKASTSRLFGKGNDKQAFNLLFYIGSMDGETQRPGLKLLVGE